MVTKCRFCDFYRETKLSRKILNKLAEPDLPEEDYMLFMERLVKGSTLKDYTSVKIHMGMKHKEDTYKYISPITLLDPIELKIIGK